LGKKTWKMYILGLPIVSIRFGINTGGRK